MQLPGFDMAGIGSYNEEKRLGGKLLAACVNSDPTVMRKKTAHYLHTIEGPLPIVRSGLYND